MKPTNDTIRRFIGNCQNIDQFKPKITKIKSKERKFCCALLVFCKSANNVVVCD